MKAWNTRPTLKDHLDVYILVVNTGKMIKNTLFLKYVVEYLTKQVLAMDAAMLVRVIKVDLKQ